MKFLVDERRTGKNNNSKLYLAVQHKVETMLNNARDIAITTDIWTSMNKDSYISITVHFLIKAQLKTLVICT